ncbi:sugar ABC transporter permease [Planotetraspora silvatica]|jgi:cellobiose transport system permease protein|uniref:Sugar ABC transporter permease n=1 Tax=Planotetraspora silvatica TaxID=234614 RepID=A0A8J3URN1_9ACTN|nr:carbohydrate ABC transporter permease [Planotetraspora silvatica]GII50093.1 sugar ABC transporter permease [Planotetraspora silvatica]
MIPRLGSGKARTLTYLTLIAVVFFSALPLYYSVVVASRDNSALADVPPPLWPGGNFVANVEKVFDTVPFALALLNSVLVAGSIAIAVMFFSTLAGFAFAKLRFRGRNALLLITVATMMVPTQLGIIPLYLIMVKLEWTGSMYALIVPALVNAFGVFFMTQFLSRALPTELLEAGRVDGCTTWGLFWHVVLPVARPAAAVLGMLTFMSAWNDYFWPLVVLTPENPTVQVALSTLAAGYVSDYALSLTGTTLGTLPLVIVFALLGKQIIGGIMQGAVKG